MLDLFKRKRGEWVNKVKALGLESLPKESSVPQEQAEEEGGGKQRGKGKKGGRFSKGDEKTQGKSAIQLAREKFAATKLGGSSAGAAKAGKGKGYGTGANQVEKIGA